MLVIPSLSEFFAAAFLEPLLVLIEVCIYEIKKASGRHIESHQIGGCMHLMI